MSDKEAGIVMIKESYQKSIDYLKELKVGISDVETNRILDIAIMHTETSSMWAVKGFTNNLK